MTEEQVRQLRKWDWVCLSERAQGKPPCIPCCWMVECPLGKRKGAYLKLYLPRNFARGDLRLEMGPLHWEELELAQGMVTVPMLQDRFGVSNEEGTSNE